MQLIYSIYILERQLHLINIHFLLLLLSPISIEIPNNAPHKPYHSIKIRPLRRHKMAPGMHHHSPLHILRITNLHQRLTPPLIDYRIQRPQNMQHGRLHPTLIKPSIPRPRRPKPTITNRELQRRLPYTPHILPPHTRHLKALHILPRFLKHTPLARKLIHNLLSPGLQQRRHNRRHRCALREPHYAVERPLGLDDVGDRL